MEQRGEDRAVQSSCLVLCCAVLWSLAQQWYSSNSTAQKRQKLANRRTPPELMPSIPYTSFGRTQDSRVAMATRSRRQWVAIWFWFGDAAPYILNSSDLINWSNALHSSALHSSPLHSSYIMSVQMRFNGELSSDESTRQMTGIYIQVSDWGQTGLNGLNGWAKTFRLDPLIQLMP